MNTNPVAVSLKVPAGVEKLTTAHRAQLCVVYIRQSSRQQVLEHRESTARQYALRELAVCLGWSPERVQVIDEDLGRSASVAGRPGFERLLTAVKSGTVGLVAGLEISRLARRSKEWYELFELCHWNDVRLLDEDGVYDPGQVNDRMILGLKSFMSNLELDFLHSRMRQGRLSKAERGELFIAVPAGYVRLNTGGVDLDPDEQVRSVVRLVFDKYQELGTARGVFTYLRQHHIQLPVRPVTGPRRGELEWRPAHESTLVKWLHHPLYAGTYVYPLRQTVRTSDGRKRTRQVPPSEWKIVLHDHVPAYISWDIYQRNQQRLASEKCLPRVPARSSERVPLLSHLLVCGHCGGALSVHYSGRKRDRAYYYCDRGSRLGLTESCHGLPARILDTLVTGEVLRALEPAALEVNLQALEDLQQEQRRREAHWHQQLERARYDADRAARRYRQVEPENRLVVRTLERDWEQTLRAVQKLEEEFARVQAEQPPAPNASQRAAILDLSQNLPKLWESAELTGRERSEILRCLLDRVVVRVSGESERVEVTMQWSGGDHSQHELVRPVAHYSQLSTYEALRARVTELHRTGHTADETAQHLNSEGFRPPQGDRFTADRIRHLRHLLTDGEGNDEWRMTPLSRELSIPESRLRDWLRRGWIHGRKSGSTWVAWADGEELSRLRRLSAAQCEEGRFHTYDSALTTPKTRAFQ